MLVRSKLSRTCASYFRMSGRSKMTKKQGEGQDSKQKSILSYFVKNQVSPNAAARVDSNTGSTAQNIPLVKHGSGSGSEEEELDENLVPAKKRVKLSPSEDQELEVARSRLVMKAKALEILDEHIGLTWFLALEKEFDKEYFKSLNTFVTNARKRGTVYPPAAQVWEWTKTCLISDVKVVILGQDPYHGPGQAHGLCFSVYGVPPPPSLQNMYNEMKQDIENFQPPSHGYLRGWADQGVLLLNTVLTVNAHQANSHKNQGWEKVTDATISWISQNLSSVVFLLWGMHAQSKAQLVDKKKHHILTAAHPSPLSAYKGFMGCKHFSKCNALLEKAGKKPIDWKYLPKPTPK